MRPVADGLHREGVVEQEGEEHVGLVHSEATDPRAGRSGVNEMVGKEMLSKKRKCVCGKKMELIAVESMIAPGQYFETEWWCSRCGRMLNVWGEGEDILSWRHPKYLKSKSNDPE